ncbi:MAG: Ig-like domain-containing protein [Gemmatimonadota bacterium]
MRPRAAVTLLTACLLVLATGSCSDPVAGIVPPPLPPPLLPPPPVELTRVVTVEVIAPATVLVREWSLLQVIARDAHGQVIRDAAPPSYSSSDASVLAAASTGVVRGVRRGSATLTVSVEGVLATTVIGVRARLKLLPEAEEFVARYGGWPMEVGDTARLAAVYVDVDGIAIEEIPLVTWQSSRAGVVTVTTDGSVAANAVGEAIVSAVAQDGSSSVAVRVQNSASTQPASIRYAHTMKGVGSITFVPNKGAPVMLSYGQSVERSIPPGLFALRMDGMPIGRPEFAPLNEFYGFVHGGDRLTLYAVGGSEQGLLAGTWNTARALPADSGQVRLVQGVNPFLVVYLRATGDFPVGLPELCYFDPHDVSPYYPRVAGGFDIILKQKYGWGALVRLPAVAPAGGAVTLVLTGSSVSDMGILTFVDP